MTDPVVRDYGWTPQARCSAEYIAPAILAILRKFRVTRVLDVGAGNGHLCSYLAAAGLSPVGAEYDEGGVEIARRQFAPIPFYRCGVQDDPGEILAREKPFEAVVSTEVVEHLFSPHLLPMFAAGVLQSDGLLVISTPYHGYLKNLALSLFNHWDAHHTALWHGGHIKFWSRKTLTELLEANGFRVIGFEGVGRAPYLWKSMILIARRITT
jgi:2-polyprenyl-3-methyl-5-hydroxy-6-metoxy-1,4-benzoquinol methylase